MLYILFGREIEKYDLTKNLILVDNSSRFFYSNYEQSWFQSDLARKIVKEIDNTEYVDGDYFKSPVFGGISAQRLSSGVKSMLILLNCDNVIVCHYC